jgi:transmembrane sensor
VHVPGARLQPIGTRFAVGRERRAAAGCVRRRGALPADVRRGAGCASEGAADRTDGGLTTVAADPLRGDWQDGRLQVQDTPLIRVIDELARHHRGYLGCDPALAALNVTAYCCAWTACRP